MVTEQHAAGALDGSVDPEELTTLLAQENQALLVTLAQLKAENSALKATQPAAGEPVADVRSAFENAWAKAMCNDEGVPGPKPLRSLVDPEQYRGGAVNGAWRWFQRGAQLAAPPAAAHGDEAVRKDAERYRWIANNVSDDAVGRGSEWHRDWRRAWRLPLLLSNNAVADKFTFEEAIDAAMRAQGDGGADHA